MVSLLHDWVAPLKQEVLTTIFGPLKFSKLFQDRVRKHIASMKLTSSLNFSEVFSRWALSSLYLLASREIDFFWKLQKKKRMGKKTRRENAPYFFLAYTEPRAFFPHKCFPNMRPSFLLFSLARARALSWKGWGCLLGVISLNAYDPATFPHVSKRILDLMFLFLKKMFYSSPGKPACGWLTFKTSTKI